MQGNLTEYFKEAKSWADDNFGRVTLSKKRYQLAFLLTAIGNILALCVIAALAHYQTLVPLIIHHYDNGVTTVEAIQEERLPKERAQIESDIARYVQFRESYDASSFRAQFELIHLLSNTQVASDYAHSQEASKPDSPIHMLGEHSKREVRIYSINFLDTELASEKDIHRDHQDLAEVVFSLMDTDKSTGKTTLNHFKALISWRYTQAPQSPEKRWLNWDGFEVIRYSKQPRMKELTA
jgi:type IV secretion system protein VirB8